MSLAAGTTEAYCRADLPVSVDPYTHPSCAQAGRTGRMSGECALVPGQARRRARGGRRSGGRPRCSYGLAINARASRTRSGTAGMVTAFRNRRGHQGHRSFPARLDPGRARTTTGAGRIHPYSARRVKPTTVGYLTFSPVTARPMSMRWISLVPSKMVKILASRCQRSTGYSRV